MADRETVTNLDIPVSEGDAGAYQPNAPQDPLTPGRLPDPVGMTNLNMFTGLLFEQNDPNPKTQYLQKKIETYRAMEADPTISGALQGYENILSVVDWNVRKASQAEFEWAGKGSYSEEKAKAAADFVKSCFDDMTMSLQDIMTAALDMLSIGFQIQAPQFKIRKGKQATLGQSSKYDDGRIGWSYWKTIDQESVYEWLTPDGEGYSELSGINQQRITGGIGLIPRDRFLLFRTTAKGDSPEGKSILHGAVCTWQVLQNVLNIEVVSLSRNLEGIPVARIPSRYLSKNATPEEQALVQYVTKVVRSLKFNEQTGLVLPSDLIDETTERLVDVELMTAGGGSSRVDACRQVALAKESLIAESILAMFLKTGSGGGGGSYALSSDLTDLFVLAMRKYLDSISQVINKEAITTLLEVNGMDINYAPVVEYSGLDKENVETVVDGIAKMIAAGAIVPSKQLQQDVMDKLDLNTDGADEEWDNFAKLQEDFMSAQTEVAAAKAAGSAAQTNNAQATIQKSKDEPMTELFHHEGEVYVMEDGKLVKLEIAA
jgi:hypothetical protein